MPDQPKQGGLDVAAQVHEDADERNFNADVLGGFFDYTPQHTRQVIGLLNNKNQLATNTCIICAGCSQKEADEGVELSVADMTSHLVNQRLMNEVGTSLQTFLKAEKDRGIAEEAVVPSNFTSFQTISSPRNLTPEGRINAAIHTSQSYWSTRSINTLLEYADKYRPGLTGAQWYSNYDNGGVLVPKSGVPTYGHAFLYHGYDLNYHGKKVLIFRNSWGKNWGDQGDFYVAFEDFLKVVDFNVYFVLDIPVDMAQWLSLNAGHVIKDNASSKCYAIVSDQKRWIQNMAVLYMLKYTERDIVPDKDNMLPKLTEGPELTIADIPKPEQEAWKAAMRHNQSSALQADFKAVFPDL